MAIRIEQAYPRIRQARLLVADDLPGAPCLTCRPPRRRGRELRGVRGGWRSPRRVAFAPNRSRVSRQLRGAGRGVATPGRGGHAVEHDVAPPGGHAWHPGQCSDQPPLSRVSREQPPIAPSAATLMLPRVLEAAQADSGSRQRHPVGPLGHSEGQRQGDGPVGPVGTVVLRQRTAPSDFWISPYPRQLVERIRRGRKEEIVTC